MLKTAQNYNSEDFRNKLKLKSQETSLDFQKKYQDAYKFLNEKEIDLKYIRRHSSKLLGAGALAGTLLLTPPTHSKNLPDLKKIASSLRLGEDVKQVELPSVAFKLALSKMLPEETRPLSRQEEKYLEQLIYDNLGIRARATLEGEHLNTTYGNIGAEQHLKRYPGDNLAAHAPENDEYGADNPQEILKEGIAPGLGAWGYFAPSKSELTQELENTERWYAVVQTLYLPEWGSRQPYLRDWYKYRKVLIVNTGNGKAVVASIADAGPAAWTGKHFGGSPEVMDYLGGPRYKEGPVLVFFVDDPNNQISLGPVEYEMRNMLLSKI